MQRIVPHIWCQGDAVQAAELYAGLFPHSSSAVLSHYPREGLLDFQQPLAGEVLVVEVDLYGVLLRLINAGGTYRPTPAISFIVNVDPLLFGGDEAVARAELDRMWAGLADGGQVRMPCGEYPFSARYGWVEDCFGVNWQLMLTDPAGEPRPFVIPQLMFTGAQPRAREAMDLYTGLLPDSGLGTVVPAPGQGPAGGGVLFAEFRLAGQWFSAMDGGVEHEFTFTPGVSLEVTCADQGEIDRLWSALSAVPEAESCGWLVDRFGVSWQIVPDDIGELLARPGAFERMLQMTKLVIADF